MTKKQIMKNRLIIISSLYRLNLFSKSSYQPIINKLAMNRQITIGIGILDHPIIKRVI